MTPTQRSATPGTISVPRRWIGTSVLVSVLVTITSLCGILLPQTYARETMAWAVQAVGQDCANLAVVVLLLVSTSFVRNHSLKGYLVWLGAYLYLIYAFAIYAFAVHFQFLFPAYVAVLGLSFYTLVGGLLAARPDTLEPALAGNPRARMAGALLFAIGVLFAVLWLSEIVPNLIAGTVPPSLAETQLPTNPVYVLDLGFLLPGMIVTAVLLWRRNVLGYLMAVPLLVFSVTMGLGIVVTFALSAARGLPSSIPAGAIVGLIMLLGALVSWLFLRDMSGVEEDPGRKGWPDLPVPPPTIRDGPRTRGVSPAPRRDRPRPGDTCTAHGRSPNFAPDCGPRTRRRPGSGDAPVLLAHGRGRREQVAVTARI